MSALEQLDPHNIPSREEERAKLAEALKQKASAAFARGELLVATLHASDALMLFPNDRAYLDLFDEIVLSTQDSLSLLPVATGAIHVATAAGRARVLMMQQNLPEALELVCAAVRVAPDIAYLDWVRRWFLVPHVIPSLSWELIFDTAVKTAIEITVDVPVPPHPEDPRLPNLRSAADYLANLRGRHSEQSVLYVAEAMARRRLGDSVAAVVVANQGVERFPDDWHLRNALANALGDAGRVDEALEQCRHALALRPGDVSPLHDVAAAFAKAGRYAEAAGLFEELLQAEPHYPGARACLHHARAMAYQSAEDREALLTLRDRQWWDATVAALADELEPPEPCINTLPGPGDASASAARHLLHEIESIVRCCGLRGHLTLGLSSRYPESPSVSAAFDAGLRALGASGELQVSADEAPSPDPRSDKAEIAYRLWSFEGDQPRKALLETDPNLQQAIAHIAYQRFHKDLWGPAAYDLAQQLGPDMVVPLLAVMTTPPPPPEELDGVYWTYRCQVAAAAVLSHMGSYPNEPARTALCSLLYGPSDWVTSAAIIAITWRALDDPSARQDADAIFAWLRSIIPSEGFTTWEIVLADCMFQLGRHDENLLRDIDAWRDAYNESLPGKNVVRPPVRRYGGLTLEQYAEFCLERDKLIGTIGYGGWRATVDAFVGGNVPPDLVALCERFGVPLYHPENGNVFPFVAEWQEALNASPALHERFLDVQKGIELERHGVSGQEKAALDNILDGNMDMHHRMAQAQMAQREVAEGDAGDPDPEVFPGQPVARLSDYVRILKGMQGGDMMGALAAYGLDMMTYGSVATAWGAKMAADPVLTEKFTRMMNG